jgi:hypothetical protein
MYRFSFLSGVWSIAQLWPEQPLPEWARSTSELISITRTADELSVICRSALIPTGVKQEANWTVIKLHGPFPFDTIGVLASFTKILAEAKISVFAISTYNTDYILVKADQAEAARVALTSAGHLFVE